MAYTTEDLVAKYKAASLGYEPNQAIVRAIDALATQNKVGGISDADALAQTLALTDSTTAVAILTRQFFVGSAPSAAGLAYLVHSDANPNDLTDANGVYATLTNQENRFINFSINLATGSGEGATKFSADYAGVSYAQTVTTAYDKIIGNATATAAGVNVAEATAYLSRAENIAFLTKYVKDSTGLTDPAKIEMAVKAALIGEILNVAVVYNLGAFAAASDKMILDLSDGTLSTDNAAGVDILAAYPAGPATGPIQTLTTGNDAIVGTNGNDTINALSIDASGAAATTFSQFDTIDGGEGVDTLNIYTTSGGGGKNTGFPTNASVKNVEIVNVYNAGGAAALGDASKFQGVKELWQIGGASVANVTNLGADTVAGFRNTTGTNFSVTPAAGVASASIAFDNVTENANLTVGANAATGALNSVKIAGTVADSNSDGDVAAINLFVNTGKNVTTLTLNTAVDVTLFQTNNAANTGTTTLTTLDASASTGAINYTSGTAVTTVTTGSGDDSIQFNAATVKDNALTTAIETVSASLTTGAGDDQIAINTTGTGKTTVSAGEGDDLVVINTRGTDTLSIDLGAGDDTLALTSATSIGWAATPGVQDVIVGGDGHDTLSMSSVVATAVSASTVFEKSFSGFEEIHVGSVGSNETATVNLTNLNDISHISIDGTAAGTVTAEVATITFTQLLSGQTVTVGGVTYENTSGMTESAATVASAFAGLAVTGYTLANPSAGVVVFTSTVTGDVPNLTASVGTTVTAPVAPAISGYVQGVTEVVATNETNQLKFQGLIGGETVTVAGKTVEAGTHETAVITFGALTAGQTFNFAGYTFTASGAATASEVLTAFLFGSTANVVRGGSLTGGYSTASTGPAQVTLTAATFGDVSNLTLTGTDAGTQSLAVTDGAFNNLTAAQVATLMNGGVVAGGTAVGTFAGWSASGLTGNQLTFTAGTAGNVADLSGSISTTAGTAPTVTKTDGINAVAPVTEHSTLTFSELADGQSVTVLGRTVTATGGDLSAADIADVFGAGPGVFGFAVVSGSVSSSWSVSNALGGDAEVEIVSTTAGTPVADFTSASITTLNATGASVPAVVITGGTGFGTLAITNLAANGTVELNGILAGAASVALKDATGTADVVNLIINGSTELLNSGTLTIAGVETINITTTDSDADVDPTAASKPNLVATAATKVVVTGNHGVDFSGSTLSALTTLDASGVASTLKNGAGDAGKITFTSTVTNKAITVTTGSGDDLISLSPANTKGGTISTGAGNDIVVGSGGVDTINLGDGNDTVVSSAGTDTITLGAGNDTYILSSPLHSTVAAIQTITDFSANTVLAVTATPSAGGSLTPALINGDIIDIDTTGATGIAVKVFTNAADAQTFIQNTASTTTNTGIALDSSTGKLYIDVDHNGVIDSVIQLTGVTTITEAAFHWH